jgi:hypothetical protein
MAMEGIDYTYVLRDLRQQKGKLEAAVAKLDAAIVAIQGLVGPLTPATGLQVESSIRPLDDSTLFPVDGPYTGKTIIAAATLFLREAGKPQHISNILDALKSGGLRTNSKSLYRTVYNTLNSNLEKEIFRTTNGLWGLKEWNHK